MNTATIASPMGPFSIIAMDDEVLASGWTANPAELSTLIAPSVVTPLRSSRDLGVITDAARAYFDGDLTAIDPISVRQHSGPFLEQAWQALRTVPAGSPISYAEFASRVGRPGAALSQDRPDGRRPGRLPMGRRGEAPAARPRARRAPDGGHRPCGIRQHEIA
jgi:methylated-DNA-[protein]-cysteine S-methyltransferase